MWAENRNLPTAARARARDHDRCNHSSCRVIVEPAEVSALVDRFLACSRASRECADSPRELRCDARGDSRGEPAIEREEFGESWRSGAPNAAPLANTSVVFEIGATVPAALLAVSTIC